MVTSGISGEMTFKRKPEEETYSASRGKSSPHSWTSWVPRWEGPRLLRPGRGGSRDGSRAIPGKCDEMWLGRKAGATSHGPYGPRGGVWILSYMRPGPHQEVSKAIFPSSSVEGRQYRNRVQGTQIMKHPLVSMSG